MVPLFDFVIMAASSSPKLVKKILAKIYFIIVFSQISEAGAARS
jgi:hypothetical protein